MLRSEYELDISFHRVHEEYGLLLYEVIGVLGSFVLIRIGAATCWFTTKPSAIGWYDEHDSFVATRFCCFCA